MKRERIEREKKIEDRLLPKKSTWQAQSCVEGVASREVSRQAQSAIPRHRSCCCWWRQRATRRGTTKTCREQETPVAANAARASSLTSPEPCSSYLASRAEASARARARSAPGRKQQRLGRATQAPGPWKQARFPNRPTIESTPRGYGHDQVAFCTWQAPICSFLRTSVTATGPFHVYPDSPFFSFRFFLPFWGGFPPQNPFSKCIFVDISYIQLASIFGRVRSYLLGDQFWGVLSIIIIIMMMMIILL